MRADGARCSPFAGPVRRSRFGSNDRTPADNGDQGSVTAVVDPSKVRPPADNALDRLTELVADDMRAVNRTIVERMDSPVPLIPQLAGYIVASGGKRLRPVLTLAAARLCGHDGNRHIGLATAVEFIHTASLLHDDVVDESDLRRGKASANEVFGNQASVLVGDFLFSRAFQLMVESGSLDVLRILSTASAVISEGEVLQLAAVGDAATTEDTYLTIIRSKTAALFEAACRVGAVVADRPATEEEALGTYGLNLGIVFQLIDDVLDYSAARAKLGKSIGDDFRESKFTLPVILAHADGDAEERAFWARTLGEGEQHDGDLEQAIALLARHDALVRTVDRARAVGRQAQDALADFADSPIRRTLIDTVDFCIEREF
ncbi:MAG: polyprenyl synthetase family protein [Inquilinus sp.]|nr:polyprenyl synthetase family protein [Inquilinus sp.]